MDYTPQVPGDTATPTAPSPYQWLRLGGAGAFIAPDGSSINEGPDSADGFDLATGGRGRLFAGQDLWLIRDTGSDGPDRLAAITETELNLSHDGVINVGAADGPGYPDVVNINAKSMINTAIGGHWMSAVHGNAISYVYGDTNMFVVGETGVIAGGGNWAATLGNTTAIRLLTNLSINIGPTISLTMGWTFAFSSRRFKLNESDTVISNLKTELATFKTAVGDVDTKISTAKTDLVAATDTKITSLRTDLNSAIDTKVGEVKTEITNAVNTKVETIETSMKDVSTEIGELRSDLTDSVNFIGFLMTL